MEREIIVLVDDDISNLKMGRNALSKNYEVYTAPSAERMFDLLRQYTPQLILLDISMPEMDGYQAIKILKDDPATKDIPIIFLTGKNDPDSELEGLRLGAIDYISKPFLADILNKRVELHLKVERQQQWLREKDEELQEFNESLQHMVGQKTKNIFELQLSILQTVADLVEMRDGETGGHVARTQQYLKTLIDALVDMDLYQDHSRGRGG